VSRLPALHAHLPIKPFSHQIPDRIIRSQTRSGINAPGELVSLEHILHEMRLIKSPAEIKLVQKAIDVSAQLITSHRLLRWPCFPCNARHRHYHRPQQ
jgi:hypothetical protein